ncbi:hypothetical protein K4H28_02440 [Deefgea tanakiae]|uniref:Polysaccharide chain length determinant N-terminal domain-containing protein n=1 Tax=Deefgea tanakiae TaxID=2865840 RepID=A0ABX8Z7C4_9NEIS|nr:Wzz/FepE/Etk N-terminal domain-containing protein [Deefgea tanakiae]QZA78295.1 hypothetical protein K4H28_02440 [Deefgea tanakiae]
MTAEIQSALLSNKPTEEDEISLLDLLLVLAKHKKKIIGLPIAAALIAAALAFSLPNDYTATLKIAPSKNAPIYNWVLGNDQVKEQVAKEMKLAEHFGTKGRQATRNEMTKAVKVTLNAKDGFLDVSATDNNPEFAALLANRMGLALKDNLYGMRLLDISKQRYDLEMRRELAVKNKTKFDVLINKPDMASTIATLSAADRYGIISLAAIQAESTLQGGVSDLMQNELVRMQDQLASLQRLVVDGMKTQSSAGNTGLWIASVDALQQQAYWDALIERLDRRIELLRKQERDELKMTAAEVPDEKSGPKRALIVLLSAFAALFASVLWAFISEAIAKSRENSQSNALLGKISTAWRSK